MSDSGCDEIQGYLLSRPLDDLALRRFVEAKRPLLNIVPTIASVEALSARG